MKRLKVFANTSDVFLCSKIRILKILINQPDAIPPNHYAEALYSIYTKLHILLFFSVKRSTFDFKNQTNTNKKKSYT